MVSRVCVCVRVSQASAVYKGGQSRNELDRTAVELWDVFVETFNCCLLIWEWFSHRCCALQLWISCQWIHAFCVNMNRLFKIRRNVFVSFRARSIWMRWVCVLQKEMRIIIRVLLVSVIFWTLNMTRVPLSVCFHRFNHPAGMAAWLIRIKSHFQLGLVLLANHKGCGLI